MYVMCCHPSDTLLLVTNKSHHQYRIHQMVVHLFQYPIWIDTLFQHPDLDFYPVSIVTLFHLHPDLVVTCFFSFVYIRRAFLFLFSPSNLIYHPISSNPIHPIQSWNNKSYHIPIWSSPSDIIHTLICS